MAIPDEDLRPAASGSGILDPLIGAGFFTPNMSLEEIKRRRAIAGALASRRRDFPKTVGEGMTYFGESLADALETIQTGRAEKAYEAKVAPELERLRTTIGTGDTLPPPVTPPVTPPPATVGPRAAIDPLTVEPTTGPASRGAIYQALARQNGAVPPGPTTTAGSPPPPSPTAGPLVSRPAALDGASFAEEGGPNPPIVSNIRPMQMAQAGPPAAPTRPTATPGGTLAPVIPPEETLPPYPVRDERMTGPERDAWIAMQKNPHDPRFKSMFEQASALGKAARDAKWAREVGDYDKRAAIVTERIKQRDEAIRNAPKTQLDLDQAAAEAVRRQDEERARIYGGTLPEPVRKALDESKEAAKLSVGVIEGINNAREAQKYAVHGLGADWKLQYYRGKAQLGDKEAERIVQASQTYKSDLTPILQSLLKIAGKDISTKELDFLRSVSGADLSLDKTSADRMLTIAEKVARKRLADHEDTVETMVRGQRPEALPALRKLYGVGAPLPGTPLVETGASTGGYKEGDIARGKPGQPDLVRRGGKWVPM